MSLVESHEYDDIIDLPHYKSQKYPHMDLYDRAAQFSPFAALTGFEDAIEETGRITEERIELDENVKEALDAGFQALRKRLSYKSSEKPLVTITYFQADVLKGGGAYITATSRVKKLDENSRRLIIEDGLSVDMDEVVGIEIVE